MREYLPYAVGAIFGLHFNFIIMTIKGYDYSINGVDLFNAVILILMVYFGKLAWKYRN